MKSQTPRTQSRARSLDQLDWLVSNLRWLLLVSVGIVTLLSPQRASLGDPRMTLALGLLAGGAAYNLLVTMLLAFHVPTGPLPMLTLVLDAILSAGLVFASGGISSPLFFFCLFPVVTASLRFSWIIGLITAASIAFVYALIVLIPALPNVDLPRIFPVLVNSLILLIAAALTGIVSDRMREILSQMSQADEQAELRKLRTAREQMRAIFELAGTLGATLSYDRILDAILDIASMGFKELGPSAHRMVSMVFLYDKGSYYIAASRHLTARDQLKTTPGKSGLVFRALQSADPLLAENPREDPELSQFVALQDCKTVLCVPLRAGFETYGLVVVASRDPSVFTSEHIEMLTAVCSQATIAMQNAQLYQSLQQEKNRIVEIEENARKQLSRDLHDGPTQSIAAIAMRLNYARKLAEHEPAKVDGELAKIEDLARRTTKEIRHMLFTLRPLVLETQGLTAALEQSLQKIRETDSSIALHLEAQPVENLVDLNTQGVIFYIIEEALGNARKHAKAANLWVRLRAEHDAVIAEVQDDGEGFDVQGVTTTYESRGSLGMVNMRERAELINGILHLDSHPGKGTTITLAVPLHKD
jgi:signal transduction histidine kinase